MPAPLARLLRTALPAGTDRDLLRAYLDGDDPAAFEEVVRRYAGLARRAAAEVFPPASDDIAQSTLTLLARKAAAVAARESAAGWVFETAHRLALKARTAAIRRAAHEHRAAPPRPPDDPLDAITLREVRAVVAEELARLPDDLRLPLILCYWDGADRGAAAARLGCSVSTLKRRLDAGRDRLAARFARRGFAGPAVLAALTVVQAGASAAGAGVAAPALGVAGRGFTSWKVLAAIVLMAGVAAAGVGLVAPDPPPVAPPATPGPAVTTSDAAGDPPPAPPAPAGDRSGDPLPPGAVARFGTIRFSHGGQVHSIAYSPDGKMIASGSFGRVMLWEAGTGKPVGPLVQREGSGHHFGLAFAEDGRRLVSVGSPTATRDAGQIVFWDVAGRRSLDAIRVQHDAGLTHWMRVVAVAPDGRTGVIGSDDGELRLIDVPGQSVRIKVETGAAVSGLAYAPDGRTLAVVTSGRPGRVLLLDPTTAETRKRLEVDHARLVVFAPDGKSVWVGCDGGMFGKDKRPGMVSRWDLRSGTAVQTFETTPGLFLSLAVSPDGKTLASGGSESGAVVWDAATGKAEELGRPPGGRVRPWVHGLAFAPDGKTLAVADTGGRVRVWDVAARRERHPNPLGSGIHRVALAPDGRTAAAAGGDGSVWVWDVATGKDIRSWMADDTRSVTDVAYSPDGRSVLTSGADGTVRLWDVAGGKEIRRFPNGPHWARSALSPDGRLVAASGKDGLSIALYEAASGRPVRELTGHVSFLHQLTFSADGRRLVSSADMHHDGKGGGDDRSVRVWDVATGRQLHAFTGERPGHVAISPDGRVVAAFGSELEPSVQGHLRFWDAVSGREIADRRIGSTTERWTVAFSPDGRYLARAARDIRLVEVASGRTAQTFETGTGSVSGLAFTPDGRRLVSTQDDGTALVWDLAPRPMAGTDAGRLWEELASPDAAVARRAVAGLAADPAAAVTLLGEKLLPIPKPAGSRTTADLIADLGSPDFATREAASQKLTARAGVDATELTAALAASTSPEVRQRLNDALRSTPGPWPTLSADDLRRVRAVAVLEAVASPDARQRLRALADGDPDARLTREARAAVVRLGG